MRFIAKPRNNDTVDVYQDDGTFRRWLVFTCDPKVAEAEEECWIACMRDDDSDTRPAIVILVEAWPYIGGSAEEWKDNHVPELLCTFGYTQAN